MEGLPGNRMAAREPYDVSPPEPWHRADRAKRFIARVDAHLPTLSDDAARRAFLDRQLEGWEQRYVRFLATEAPRSSRPILTIRRTPPSSCSPSLRLRRGASRLGADSYAVVPATEATHDHPAGHRPRPLPLSPACAGIGAVTA